MMHSSFGGVGNIPPATGAMDLLGGEGLDSLLGPSQTSSGLDFGGSASGLGGLSDIFGLAQSPTYVPPQEVWLSAMKGKGLEISGTFSRKNAQLFMELTLTNKAMQPMMGFAVQFNKNSFGLVPSQQLSITSPLMPNQSTNVNLPLAANGPVQLMQPLSNLQVAVKNNIDVFYFSCVLPMHTLFVEDGEMEKRTFLATWKDIPVQNEVQYEIKDVQHNADTVAQKLRNNNVFTVAKRNVEGQDMLYQSIKLSNGIWVLAELKIQPTNPNFTLSLKARANDVYEGIHQVYETILHL